MIKFPLNPLPILQPRRIISLLAALASDGSKEIYHVYYLKTGKGLHSLISPPDRVRKKPVSRPPNLPLLAGSLSSLSPAVRVEVSSINTFPGLDGVGGCTPPSLTTLWRITCGVWGGGPGYWCQQHAAAPPLAFVLQPPAIYQ